MKTHRVWVEIVLLSAAIACALALLIASLGAAAAAVDGASAQQSSPATIEQSYEGMVTCSRCGAKHSAVMGYTADACVRICIHGGASFALVNPQATYLLDGDLFALKKLAGQRVRVVGTITGNTIRVVSVTTET